MKVKFNLEYSINSSPKILYSRLNSSSGLAEWFADDVNQNGEKFTFIWNGSEEEAILLHTKENISVRFQWVEDEDTDYYFEFKINIDDLTGDVALEITDYIEEGDEDDATDLWDSQIANLKQILGR